MMKRKRSSREHNDRITCLKLATSLVEAIDQDAQREGLTRSAVIRRALIEKYRDRLDVSA